MQTYTSLKNYFEDNLPKVKLKGKKHLQYPVEARAQITLSDGLEYLVYVAGITNRHLICSRSEAKCSERGMFISVDIEKYAFSDITDYTPLTTIDGHSTSFRVKEAKKSGDKVYPNAAAMDSDFMR